MGIIKELDDAEMWAEWNGIAARRIGDCLLLNGDSAEVLPMLGDGCLDAVVTDPPYGLSKEPNMSDVLAAWISGEDYRHGARRAGTVPGERHARRQRRSARPVPRHGRVETADGKAVVADPEAIEKQLQKGRK